MAALFLLSSGRHLDVDKRYEIAASATIAILTERLIECLQSYLQFFFFCRTQIGVERPRAKPQLLIPGHVRIRLQGLTLERASHGAASLYLNRFYF